MDKQLRAQRARALLVDWYGYESRREFGDPDPLLPEVTQALRDDLANEGSVSADRWIELANAVEKSKQKGPPTAAVPTIPLDEESAKIIRALRAAHPQLLTALTISADADVALATAKGRIRKLIESLLVHRPLGENSGAGLTDAGLKLADELPPARI